MGDDRDLFAVHAGWLGGALASKWRIDAPLFSHTLFGVYLGIVMWASLWLRDAHFRSMVLGMVKPA